MSYYLLGSSHADDLQTITHVENPGLGGCFDGDTVKLYNFFLKSETLLLTAYTFLFQLLFRSTTIVIFLHQCKSRGHSVKSPIVFNFCAKNRLGFGWLPDLQLNRRAHAHVVHPL